MFLNTFLQNRVLGMTLNLTAAQELSALFICTKLATKSCGGVQHKKMSSY
jgi:hypothetical protein